MRTRPFSHKKLRIREAVRIGLTWEIPGLCRIDVGFLDETSMENTGSGSGSGPSSKVKIYQVCVCRLEVETRRKIKQCHRHCHCEDNDDRADDEDDGFLRGGEQTLAAARLILGCREDC